MDGNFLQTFPQSFPISANVLKNKRWNIIAYSPVDSLHRIVVFRTIILFSVSGLLIFSITSSAAFRPISSRGGSMVVIRGETMVDSSVPEKLATKISSGTRLPKARSRF